MLNEQSKELRDACFSLRIGDTVTIHLDHYGDNPRGVPFTVKLTRVDQRESSYTSIGSRYEKTAPLVHWEPRGEIDMMKLSNGESTSNAFCSASFITEIVEREPYKINHNAIRNALFSSRLERIKNDAARGRTFQEYSSSHVAGPLRIVHGIAPFAVSLLSYDPQLDIPRGISAERLTAEWQKAGYPGLRGGYHWRDKRITPYYPHNQFDNGAISIGDVVEMVIHRRQFHDWAVANLSRIICTKAELVAIGKHHADLDRKSYEKDMEDDMDLFESRGGKLKDEDDEEDTFERHLEEMIDWD